MWVLKVPQLDTEETYRICISRVRNPALKARLEAVTAHIVLAAEEYALAASTANLHTLAAATLLGDLTTQEMVAVYGRMVRKASPGRRMYDLLLASSPYGRCPLCGQRIVSTLDHHLPKAHYPALVVTPVNLVPACRDCNDSKKDVIPRTGSDVTLHPYFDNVQDERWLFAEVVEGNPAAFRFYVVPHHSWNEVTGKRVQRHFKLIGLAKLYAAQAAQEMVSNRFHLSQLLAAAGEEAVQAHLREMAASRADAQTNSWQTAAYEAFAGSQWFCNGGFQYT